MNPITNIPTIDERRRLAAAVADDLYGEIAHSFDAMDDLESYTLRRDGMVTARKVA